MKINRMITAVNRKLVGNTNRIKFIVIHYVGATGDAKANCNYFKTTYRGSSAHYFVGHGGDIWQCVEDADVAWHCGAIKYKHSSCRNNNSIGIELCCKKDAKGKWYFTEETVAAAIELTRELMKKYNVAPTHVIRHFDVTGKQCPEPFVRSENDWRAFKNSLTTQSTSQSNEKKIEKSTDKGKLVKITANTLYVRAGAGVKYEIKTQVKKGEVYTIVEEENGWGKLKSGAGWISLAYTQNVG